MNTLKLSEPAYIVLATADGDECRVDAYEARRMLAAAQQKPEAEQLATILDWLAERLGCDRAAMGENQALDFNDLIVEVVNRLNVERKKKRESIASWQFFTQESPEATATGPKKKNKRG